MRLVSTQPPQGQFSGEDLAGDHRTNLTAVAATRGVWQVRRLWRRRGRGRRAGRRGRGAAGWVVPLAGWRRGRGRWARVGTAAGRWPGVGLTPGGALAGCRAGPVGCQGERCKPRAVVTADPAEALREVEREIIARRPEHAIEPSLDDPGPGRPARRPAAGLSGHPLDRDQRQDLDRPDDRDAAARPGLRTGLFTSPHLRLPKTICVDGEPLSADRFVAAYQEILPYLRLVDATSPSRCRFSRY